MNRTKVFKKNDDTHIVHHPSDPSLVYKETVVLIFGVDTISKILKDKDTAP